MNTLAKQRGVTAIGWLVILGLIGFFVFIGLKLFPLYAENFSVVSSLKSLQNEPQVTRKTKQEITKLIMSRFSINDVKNATRSCLDISKRNAVLTVTCSYSVTTELFGPLSLVADFEESVEVVGN
jgi:hypothetical protein